MGWTSSPSWALPALRRPRSMRPRASTRSRSVTGERSSPSSRPSGTTTRSGRCTEGSPATLADSALGCAVHTKLSAGTRYTSLDLTIKFTRAATVDSGLLTCEGRVVSIGRRAATAEAQITDQTGRVIGHAVATCLIMQKEQS
ncbi:PaaI family thioesterase [Nocardioides sp. B-3]|uniref:PaaI family thioesterase n=1 Tax=Nocardioides sp. B-3 TaxID=2895565 RepID=UPI003FA53475